jgi:hypothetical protein
MKYVCTDADPADICSGTQVQVGLPKSKRALMEK